MAWPGRPRCCGVRGRRLDVHPLGERPLDGVRGPGEARGVGRGRHLRRVAGRVPVHHLVGDLGRAGVVIEEPLHRLAGLGGVLGRGQVSRVLADQPGESVTAACPLVDEGRALQVGQQAARAARGAPEQGGGRVTVEVRAGLQAETDVREPLVRGQRPN
jgi:hypothetical protein